MPNKHKLSNGTLLDGLACLTGKWRPHKEGKHVERNGVSTDSYLPTLASDDSALANLLANEYWALVLKLKSADTSYSSRSCSTSSREHSRAVCTV
ncbi:hypothetical protein RRG08_048123 [Elysia crispata]|uniref:Uncharacterized protein n=1 Tax=Elysia crispata TaxID=231223 RepID=A0AAE0ZIE3_9GAST|nr:hypothetical protein RRG08_048123 [Elysia crispata]